MDILQFAEEEHQYLYGQAKINMVNKRNKWDEGFDIFGYAKKPRPLWHEKIDIIILFQKLDIYHTYVVIYYT